MIAKTYSDNFEPERIISYALIRRDFTPTPEQMQVLREWADPKKRAEKEREGDRIIQKLEDGLITSDKKLGK